MKGKKMFRVSDSVFTCKECKSIVNIGFSILQEISYEKHKNECIEKSLCSKCLIKKKVDSYISDDKVLTKTAVNMIALGVLA
jgi:hypothetical protein